MDCKNPVRLSENNEGAKKREAGTFPCGKCRACRIQRSREWAVRMYHEIGYHDGSVFVTLTYDEETVPYRTDMAPTETTLKKEDAVEFIKKLREIVYPRKIKYYLVGEYGENNTKRPHFHVVLFGIRLFEHKVYPEDGAWKCEDGPVVKAWSSKRFGKKGNVVLGTATYDSVRYVADYIHKKLYGKAAIQDGRLQPFSMQSQGIGRRYALENREKITEELGCKIRGVEVGLPRYYVKVLDIQEEVKRRGKQREIEDYNFWIEKYGIENAAKMVKSSIEQVDKNLKEKGLVYRKGKI